jgi:hypothetical protein
MRYRRLNDFDVRVLIKEHEEYERWRVFVEYALKVYGSAADRIVVETNMIYNDESDVLSITRLDVFDQFNCSLTPDWTTDWWYSYLGESHAEITARPWNFEDWRDPRNDAIYDLQHNLPVPTRNVIFWVHQPPERRFAKVYVPDEYEERAA